MSTDIDFDFIKEVGEKVCKIYLNDPNQSDWFYSIIDEYNNNDQYPQNVILSVFDYLKSLNNEESEKLISDIKRIILDEDNVSNLLGYIFYPSINEEEEEEADDTINSKSLSIQIDDNEEEEEININNLDSKAYFETIIKKVMDTLCISHDIAYLLCKKFNLNKELIFEKWLSSQDEILKSLRIKVGSEAVPNLKSPLEIKSCGIGECPICLDEIEIFQLYCGHKLCKECLISEMKELISGGNIPVCRGSCEDDDDKLCSSEIMINDVKNFLNDDELFEKYNNVLAEKEALVLQGIRKCPNEYCDAIITPFTEIPCHVGRCSQCGAFVCLKCKQDCHAPIFNCSRVDNFFIDMAEYMQKLKDDQKRWAKREMKLIDYRFSNKTEIHSSFNVKIQNLKKQYIKMNSEANKKISEMAKEVSLIQENISFLRKKLITLDCKSDEYKIVEGEIKRIQTIHDQKEVILKRYQIDSENNIKAQTLELDSIEQEENLLSLCYSRNADFKSSFFNYEIFMNAHAVSKIKLLSQDWINDQQTKEKNESSSESVIKGLYKKCPTCNSPIERISGCNHMTCTVCHTEFCYICGGLWSSHIGYICPKYEVIPTNIKGKKKGKNYSSNEHDKVFYQPPMNVDERVNYFRWNNSYSQFQIKKEKYNEIFADFKNKKNLKPEPGEIVYADSKLCTRNKIAKVLLKTVERKDIKMKTYRIMNEILFAKSVIMWGYPALFYMANYPDKAMLFEYKLFLLEEATDKFIDLIHKPGKSTSKDFDMNVDILERQIIDILTMAEEF